MLAAAACAVALAVPVIHAWGQYADDEFVGLSDEQLRSAQNDLLTHYTAGKALSDPVLQQYITQLNKGLSAKERRLVSFVNDGKLNAYAAWGNVLVLNSGLLIFMENEDELVGVLAHEHAHLDHKHFHRLPKASSLVRDLSAAGFLAAVLVGSPEAANVFAGTSGLAQNMELATLRAFEREADQQAVRQMHRAGYDPKQFAALLERMGSTRNVGLPEYLLTHPLSENRVSDLHALIRSLGLDPQGGEQDIDLDFWLVRERAIQATNTSNDKVEPPGEVAQIVNDYGDMISKGPRADEAAQRLMAHSDEWIVAVALADHHVAAGNAELAEDVLSKAQAANPGNSALLAKELQVLGSLGKRKEAVKRLAKISTDMRNNRWVAEAESRLWDSLGDVYNYRLAVGFKHYLSGNLNAAKDQVARLKELESDSISASSLARTSLLEEKIDSLEEILNPS